MSPRAGAVLVDEIAPRLRSAVPQVAHTVGAEDSEELYQDGLAMAAKMLHDLEERGKVVTLGNVAYYTILHLKSGRRSTGNSRADVMASGTQMCHRSCVLSLETEVGYDPELDEPIRLEEMLTSSTDDPSITAARNLDWEAFLRCHDYRYAVMVEGKSRGQMARLCRVDYWKVGELKTQMASDILDFMDTPLEDAMEIPSWRSNLQVDREKMACRADRRRG
jgi:hypothetical protein